jgi:DNA invertase Pin-like site-specific DNA recombinase
MRAITYARVSTGRQAESGLSLDDQATQTAEAVARRGWQLAARYIDTASAASMSGRPQLAAALDRLARGEADALVVAKLDRLARSSLDLATLLARAQRERWSLVVLDLDVDTSTPTGELLASIVGTVAQYERRLIAARASMTHAQRRRRGLRAGEPPRLDPALRTSIAARVSGGESLHSIARSLNEAETPTARGGRWYPSTVAHVARSVALDVALDAGAVSA